VIHRRPFVGGLLLAIAAARSRLPALAEPATVALLGIDHIPLAVKDLERATETYRRLGFAIKPGRFHADGIRNNSPRDTRGVWLEFRQPRAP
jgi:Glyoxalase-like domain